MKRIIFKVSLLMIILAANIGVLYADVIIDKGDIVIICTGGDGYGNYIESECVVIIRDEQKRETDGGGGGGGGIFIPPPDPVPYIPTTPMPDPTGGGTGTNDGGTGTPGEITINDKPTIEDETEPIEPLEQICSCNNCPDCGGCILEPGETLPSGCKHKCDCPPPCECCGKKDCDRTCQVVASTTLVNPPYSSKDFNFNGGQKVVISVTNCNILLVTMNMSDNILGGETINRILLPNASFNFTASRFGEPPIWWRFTIQTISDAACLNIIANSCY